MRISDDSLPSNQGRALTPITPKCVKKQDDLINSAYYFPIFLFLSLFVVNNIVNIIALLIAR